MKFRTPLLAAALLAVPVLASCGGDDSSSTTTIAVPGDNDPVGTDTPGSTAAPDGSGFEHPTGPDDVVISIGYEGGFVPAWANFNRTPTLLVAGDGRVYTPGAITLQYPGPMLTPTEVRTLDEAGIQALLALADEHGLLAEPPVYERNDQIADAADTVVEITVGGETYRHQAYALGLTGPEGTDTETDPARKALAEFVEAASNPATAVPDGSLSDGEILEGDMEIQAIEADPANYDAPTITPWASDTGITLAGSTECSVVAASDATATALLNEATQATLFTEGDVTYQVAVRPQLPGGAPC